MKKFFTLLIVLFLWAASSQAQVVTTESFDGATFVPSGWTNFLVSGTNTWTRVTAGTTPTQAPHSGAGEAKFNSYSANGGVRALITPVFDLGGNTSGAAVSFWMYRDNGYATTADKIDVFYNTAANMTGAVSLGTVNRAIGLAPVVAANGWYQYSYTIPNTVTSSTVYLIFRGTSAYGNNIYIDDVSWTSYPVSPALTATPSSLAFGFAAFGSSSTEFTYGLNGINLTAGPIVVTAPTGFGVSLTTGGPYTSSVNVTYTPPTLASTTIYCKFTPTAAGTSYSGNITNVGGGANANVSVTGSSDLFSLYCASAAGNSGDEEITNVTFGSSLNNTSACASLTGTQGTATGTADLYSNFTSIAATTVNRGVTYPISVQITECAGSPYSHDVRVYIDFNQNGSLTDVGEEFIIWSYASSNTHIITANINIPVGAVLGNTLMRVVCKESSTTGPCVVGSWGETEDYKINIDVAPACLPVATLTATGIDGHNATLGWTENGTATSWELEWGLNGFTQGTGTTVNVTTTPTYALSGLAPVTAYAYYVRANCEGSFSTWTGPKTFTTTVACPAPTALTATPISSSKESLGWTDATGTAWEIEYGLNGFTQGTGTMLAGVTNNPYSITGLTAATSYQFYVRRDCSGAGDGYSTWAGPFSFTTLCDPMTDFIQKFDGVTSPALPPCWSKYISPSYSFQTVTTITTTPNSSPNCVQLYSSGATLAADAPLLISPIITNMNAGTQQLRFYAKGASTNTSVIVGTMSDPLNSATFTPFQTITGLSTTGWNEYAISFASYAGSDQYIAFRHPLTTTYSYIYIDDVVWETIPTCIQPTALNATNLGGHTADLSWTADAGNVSWDIEYGLNGFTPTGTPTQSGVTNPVTVSGLASSSNYAYYVRANCGSGGYSIWAGPKTFATAITCVAPTALSATLNSLTTATLGWTDASGASWKVEYGVTGFLHGAGTIIKPATNPQAISGLTAATNYQFYVKTYCADGDSSAWAGPYAFYTGYCQPHPSSVDNLGITNVTFSTVNNTTVAETGNYGDYSAMVGDITQTNTVNVSITFNTLTYDYNTKIWIDWNDDLDFADAGEDVYTGLSSTTSPNTLVASFSVSGTAPLGQHRMRIGAADFSAPDACYTGSYGTFEDYTVNVLAFVGPYFTALPTALSFGSVLNGSTSAEFSYALNGYYLTPASGDITVTPPANFEVSFTSGGPYSSTPITASYTSGAITKTVYAVFKPTAGNTAYSGNIANDGGGASTVNVGVTGSSPCDVIIAPFTEDFEVVPPPCWTVYSATSNAWAISSAASGYGVGSKSAIAAFFSYSDATPFYIFTPVFDASGLTSPKVKFDFAYATYTGGEEDAMNVLYSTDGGATFSTLHAMLGGPTGDLNTGGTVSGSFVPTSAQWSSLELALPAGTNMVAFEAISAWGNNLYIDNVQVYQPAPTTKTLNMTVLLEGLYNGTGTMRKAQGYDIDFNVVDQFAGTVADQVTVELHDATTPYAMAYEFTPIDLNTDGTLTISVLPGTITGSYYIAVKHRNSIQTWSANPFDFSGAGPFTYDFTLDAANAYGSNVKDLLDGYFAFYCGDVDQDGGVGSPDMGLVDNQSAAFGGGYIPEDVDGDGSVGTVDMGMVDNNSSAFVGLVIPGAKKKMIHINK
jgi:hypothetical protein